MQTENNNWEMQDLEVAVRRMQSNGHKVTFNMMIEWKRSRGMLSCRDVSTERGQVRFLRSAMRYLESKGIHI